MLKGVFTSVMLNETQSAEKTLWRTTIDNWKWALWALKRVRMFFFSIIISSLKLFTVQYKKKSSFGCQRWCQANFPAHLNFIMWRAAAKQAPW